MFFLLPFAAAAGVTGSLATTNAADAASAAGTTAVTGALARSNANDACAASGSVGMAASGTVARTNANDTANAVGTTTVRGTVARTNAGDTSAASGSVGGPVSGSVATANANDTAAASGATTVSGASATTNGNDSVSASGSAASAPAVRPAGHGTRKRGIAIEAHGHMLYFEDEDEAREWLKAQEPKQAKVIRKLARKAQGGLNLLAPLVYEAPVLVSGPPELRALIDMRAAILKAKFTFETTRLARAQDEEDEDMTAAILMMID